MSKVKSVDVGSTFISISGKGTELMEPHETKPGESSGLRLSWQA